MAFNFGKMKPKDKSVQQATMQQSLNRMGNYHKHIDDKTNPYPAEDWKSVHDICEGNLITAYDANEKRLVWREQLKDLFGNESNVASGESFIGHIYDKNVLCFVYNTKDNFGVAKDKSHEYIYEIAEISSENDMKELTSCLEKKEEEKELPLFVLRYKDDAKDALTDENLVVEFMGLYKLNKKGCTSNQRIVWEKVSETYYFN